MPAAFAQPNILSAAKLAISAKATPPFLIVTAPDETLKLSELKLAAPKADVVALSMDTVNVVSPESFAPNVAEPLIAPYVANVNVPSAADVKFDNPDPSPKYLVA